MRWMIDGGCADSYYLEVGENSTYSFQSALNLEFVSFSPNIVLS